MLAKLAHLIFPVEPLGLLVVLTNRATKYVIRQNKHVERKDELESKTHFLPFDRDSVTKLDGRTANELKKIVERSLEEPRPTLPATSCVIG